MSAVKLICPQDFYDPRQLIEWKEAKCLYPQRAPISIVQMNSAIERWRLPSSYCGEGCRLQRESCKEPYTTVETQGILRRTSTEDLWECERTWDRRDSPDHLQLWSERDASGTLLVRMMGSPGRVCCEHHGWIHQVIRSIACMAIYTKKLLYRTPHRVWYRGDFGDSCFQFLARR
jgi:hypothetical protein